MHVWLVQRAESTPHDANGKRRLMRMGILAKRIQAAGHRVTWWTSGFDHVSKTHRVDSTRSVEVLPRYDIHYLDTRGYSKNVSIGRFLDNRSLTESFRREIRNADRPDVILASIPSVELAQASCEYGAENGVPVALDVRDLYPDVFEDLAPRPLRQIVRLASSPMRQRLRYTCAKATCILGITEGFVDWGVAHAGRSRTSNDRVFPMAYEKMPLEASLRPEAEAFWAERLMCMKPDHLQVLFLGTFTNSFDFDPVLQAARLLSEQKANVAFTFCGTGARQAALMAEVAKLDNCDFTGWIDAHVISRALECADVGLAPYIPSPNFIQNIPNKPAEYLSGGLVVASALNEGTLYDLLTEYQVGFSYGKNAEILANRLVDLEQNSDQRSAMKAAALDTFDKHFSAEQTYGALVTHLETLAERCKRMLCA